MKTRMLFIFCMSACLMAVANPSAPSPSGPEQAAALERKIDLINELMSQRLTAARVMDDLSTALPSRVWLTEVVYGLDEIRIKGHALSNSLLADYVSRLEHSPALTEVALLSSIQRGARNREFQEFALRALVKEVRGKRPAKALPGSGSDAVAALTRQLEELEKIMPERKETADILRELQRAAGDSGLKLTKFAPGSEIPREFYNEWPISIEVTGSRQALRRFFARVADLPRLWVIVTFSFNAISLEDADLPVRASLTARTYFLRQSQAGS